MGTPLHHTVIGELIHAELDTHDPLPTITLHLRQCARGYTHQRIVALRSYGRTPDATRQAQHDHAALHCGQLYRVAADAISSTAGAVYMLGVQSVAHVPLPPPAYLDARGGMSQVPDGDAGLAMSLPGALLRGAA